MSGPLFGLLVNPGGRREQGFLQACREMGLPAPRVIPWQAWLTAAQDERRALLAGLDALRIETPAENDEVERLLLTAGADACEREATYPFLTEEASRTLPADQGELRWQRQWYLGWQSVLEDLTQWLDQSSLRAMNSPQEIATLFDKLATRERLAVASIPIPPGAGLCESFEHLIAIMDARRWDRVFLKPCHGSSASGVMAIAKSRRGEWRVVSSAALKEGHIFNCKRLRALKEPGEIAALVDAVCRERALIERWFPKASIDGRVYDLRVLVIAGELAHTAVRTSQHPITNLHLANQRGDPSKVIASLAPGCWEEAMETARRAALNFPGCHYCGVDLMIGANRRSIAIAEVNAFGDLLHHELWRGMTPWKAELALWPAASQYESHLRMAK